MIKPKFKKADLKGMKCFYCPKLAHGTFNFSNNDEVPVCFGCASKKGKTKGQRRNMPKIEKQTILGITDEGNKGENSILLEGLK